MNKAVISKEELLKTAKAIVFEEGMDKLNIRRLAQQSGVSVGSVYNYFASKSDLMLAVLEEFWKILFHSRPCVQEAPASFPDFFEEAYAAFFEGLSEFKFPLLQQMRPMQGEEAVKARMLMEQYISHIRKGFAQALEADPLISESIWSESFSKEQFAFFVTSSMLEMLTRRQKDCLYFKEILKRILYAHP